MKIKKSYVLLAVIVLLVVGYFAYEKATYVHMDLSTLREYATTQRYDVIIESIQAKPVPPDGFTFLALKKDS